MSLALIKKAKCCACGGKVGRVNLCTLRKRATWEFPRSGNVLTGDDHAAVAVCCDACIERRPMQPIRWAIELAGDQILYHDLASLKDLGPEPTHVLRNGAIECLVCGLVSHHPDDVANLYCGACHAYHPIGAK